jgi:hypothetical protein
VSIPLGDYEIWFTQTHIAEIKLLIKYEKEAKSGKIPKPKTEVIEQEEESEETTNTTNSIDFSGFIGKKLYRDSDGTVGIIKSVDNEYVTLDVIAGPKEGKLMTLKSDILLDVSGKYKIQ